VGRRRVLGSGRSDDDRLIAEVITAVREPRAAYPVAISLVALIGSFNVLHSAVRFASRGLVRPASQNIRTVRLRQLVQRLQRPIGHASCGRPADAWRSLAVGMPIRSLFGCDRLPREI
jgi:hypothetical protein